MTKPGKKIPNICGLKSFEKGLLSLRFAHLQIWKMRPQRCSILGQGHRASQSTIKTLIQSGFVTCSFTNYVRLPSCNSIDALTKALLIAATHDLGKTFSEGRVLVTQKGSTLFKLMCMTHNILCDSGHWFSHSASLSLFLSVSHCTALHCTVLHILSLAM